MSENEHVCLVCDNSSREIPLIALEYHDQFFYICPQHLPILIHHPEQLTDKLPGAEKLIGHEDKH
jgi:hypothetical protein